VAALEEQQHIPIRPIVVRGAELRHPCPSAQLVLTKRASSSDNINPKTRANMAPKNVEIKMGIKKRHNRNVPSGKNLNYGLLVVSMFKAASVVFS
jgi:hypothetical protein